VPVIFRPSSAGCGARLPRYRPNSRAKNPVDGASTFCCAWHWSARGNGASLDQIKAEIARLQVEHGVSFDRVDANIDDQPTSQNPTRARSACTTPPQQGRRSSRS
jgi:hypothetical protein